MKKIIALLLCLCTLIPMLIACGETETTPTPTGTTATPGTTASTKEIMTEQGLEAALDAGTYEFKHTASGVVLGSDDKGNITPNGKNGYISVDWSLWQGRPVYRLGLFGIEIKDKIERDYSGKEISKTPIENYESIRSLGVTQNAKTVKEGDYFATSAVTNHWRVQKNEDGTFYFRSNIKPSYYLTCANGEFVMSKDTDESGNAVDVTAYKWTLTDKSTDNPYYYEYKSEDSHILLRVPLNVYDEDQYSEIRVSGQPKSHYAPKEETLIEYANSIQKIKDTYTDLCAFEPYNVIIIHAYNYQGVMAGVVGNNNNVYVNAGEGEWFYEDLQDLQFRKEVLGKVDCGFVNLHEIGHMYDSNRSWNFESEMTADLKAAYFLVMNPDYVAAPAEFRYDEYMDSETVPEGYSKLSGGKMTASDDEAKANYSIYRNAQINTEICEEIGWEHLKATFHWFQTDKEGKKWRPECSGDRMAKFYEKLSEFSGKDVLSMYDAVELKEVWKNIDKDHEQHLADREDSADKE